MSSSFSGDQLQPDDTLDDRGVDDVLDEGMSPPERPSREMSRRITAREDAEGETLDERLEEEEPDPLTTIDYSAEAGEETDWEDTAPSEGFEVGDDRPGGLAGWGDGDDDRGGDVGMDAGAASAEEAAVHIVDEDLP